MKTERVRLLSITAGVLLCLFSMLPAGKALVTHQNLATMCSYADRIFAGRVVDVEVVSVNVGGGEFPATRYRIEVTESFKGSVDAQKGDQGMVELTMIGSEKPLSDSPEDRARWMPLPEMPRLEKGANYLLLTNAANANGLASTIGLGQGRFEIDGSGDRATVRNEINNMGLFSGMPGSYPSQGPISYSTLADAIRELVNQ